MKSNRTVTQRRTSKYMRAVRIGERIIPKKVISSKKRYKGICAICENAPTCIYKRNLKNPVLNCEEFKAIFPERSIYSAQNTPVNQNTPAKMNNKENEYSSSTEETGYKGLCANCNQRKTCIYPKPEGGVWACEEYE